MNQFAKDVKEGLSSYPKRLSSKYFYDVIGDELFRQIMQLDDYYLTRAELEVFETYNHELLSLIGTDAPFKILELGAGDGYKTKVLLRHFLHENANFSYDPVDISANVLDVLKKSLEEELPDLEVDCQVGDYFDVLNDLKRKEDTKSFVFFLGSNIGNFQMEEAVEFLHKILENLNTGDLIMIGFDLKKDPKTILKAYDDSEGVTRKFNLNLLERVNRELDANFKLDHFDHNPIYDPMTGQCRSYLISKEAVDVHIGKLDCTVHFNKWEPIFMEVSKKYDELEIQYLAEKAGFRMVKNFFDSKKQFCDSVWEVI